MKPFSRVCQGLAGFLMWALASAGSHATDYITTLTLQDPGGLNDLPVPFVEQVVFRWSIDLNEGSQTEGELTALSVELYTALNAGDCVSRNSGCEQTYYDQVISGSTIRPLPGTERTSNDPIWDFDLSTLTLEQFRNIDFGTIPSTTGRQVLVTDGLSLPLDGVVRMDTYVNGAETNVTVAQLQSQRTVIDDGSASTALAPACCTTLAFVANLTHGWQFTPTRDITINALGWSDPDQLGLNFDHEVGLFHVDSDRPIVTRTVTTNSRLSNGYRYENIAPLRLSAGETYIIAGYDPGGALEEGAGDRYALAPVADTVISDAISYEGYVSASGAGGLVKPNGTPAPEIACCARWAVNFEFDESAGQLSGPWSGGQANPPVAGFTPPLQPATTTVVSDGTDGLAVFSYNNNFPYPTIFGSGARDSWEFSTVASATGPVDLDPTWSGYHAFFQVRTFLEFFLIRDGVTIFSDTLVTEGPINCCTPPSGGFGYPNASLPDLGFSVDVQAGDIYGFRLAGSNGDQDSRMFGTLSVSVFNPVSVANPIADVTVQEDSGIIVIDVSDTFTPPEVFEPDISIENPSLFGAFSVTYFIGGGVLELELAPDQNGSSEIKLEVTAENGSTATDSFIVTVLPVNDVPLSQGPLPDLELVLGDPNPTVDLGSQFTDADIATNGDSLSYSANSVPSGIVDLSVVAGELVIEGIGVGTTTVTVTATDEAGETASESFSVVTEDPEFLGDAVLVQAVTGTDPDTGEDLTFVAINATGLPGESTQTVELLTASSCSDGTLGEDAVVFAEVIIPAFDENGEAFLTSVIPTPGPIGSYATARIRGQFSSGESASCVVAGPDNDSWVRALELALTPSGEVSIGDATGFLDREGNARWYRFRIQPGARVTVDLSSLPKDYDLFLFKDIAAVFQELEGDNDVDGLNRLGAEFAPSTFAPSTFAPALFAPSTFAPDAYAPSTFAPSTFASSVFAPSTFAPSTFAPSTYSPSTFAPSTFAPSTFAPSTFAPSTFAPSTFAPSTFAPENFVSAQVRSLIAVSAQPGTGSEQVVADTWNNTGFFYVRVSGKNGSFDVGTPFQLDIEVDGVDCTGVEPLTETVFATANDYRSIILWDSGRINADPSNTPSEVAELRANLDALATRPEVNGVLLDLAEFSAVQALQLQSDNNVACPYADNLTAEAIKGIIDEYRESNPNMAYVVLVGSDSHIPFFRYPDQGLLGPEQDYNPPVSDGTQSQSALRLNYILGQDQYGAANTLSLRDGIFPLPGLAVGRLVETARDMNEVLEAYLATDAGVVDTPTSTLVTGYDFLTDAANEVQFELVAGTAVARNDTLVTAADISPDDPRSWTADDLRRELLDEREDIVFLAGHFSANSALAADYKTTTLTTELAASTTDFTNAIVFSAGCHSGYNIVNEDIVPGVTQPLDWPQAFARKGATLIAGTGYQYGDTDFVEYGERLYAGFARELRTGLGRVSIGEALVRAKQDYLATTPDIRGLHRKTIIISTVFGLPMLSVDMPGERIVEPPSAPTITPALVAGNPGELLGLQVADIGYRFEDGFDGEPLEQTVELTNLEGGTLTATYFEGPQGVVSNPAEPALPLYTRNVTPVITDPLNLLSLRGVGFRGGAWNESVVLPLTGAPTTELRGVHTPFTSPVYFPMRLANSNYFDALTGGGTTLLHVTPVQHRSAQIGDIDSILRKFSTLGFRLYYSGNTVVYGPNLPALAGPPTMSGVEAVIDGNDIVFSVNVIGDASAGIHEVWVTYTDTSGASGQWISLDLTQDPVNSTLWSGRLAGAVGAPYDYIVQAASGTGLVTINDNFGAFFKIAGSAGGPPPGEDPPEPAVTELTLDAPFSGAYGDKVSVSANLSAELFPLEDANVVFTIGGAGRVGRTDANGDVTVELPLTAPPGDYAITASYAGNAEFEPADAEQMITITPTATFLSFEFGEQSLGVNGIEPGLSARLLDAADRPLLQRTVYFTLEGGPVPPQTVAMITDNTGLARLRALQVPPGSYTVTARFLGQIPTSDGVLELDDPVYEPSENSTSILLESACPSDSGAALFAAQGAGTAFAANTSSKKGKKGKSGKHRRDDDDDDDHDDDDDDDRGLVLDGFCYITSDVRDPVKVRNGTLIIGEGVTMRGKIDQYGEGSVIVLETAVVKQKITERGPGSIIVHGEVTKKIREQDAGNIEIGETGHVNGNVDETRDGSILISGSVRGNVKETGDGDLVVTPTGFINGKAQERGEGMLVNDGTIRKSRPRDDDDDDDDEDDDD